MIGERGADSASNQGHRGKGRHDNFLHLNSPEAAVSPFGLEGHPLSDADMESRG
jgi:hypothetical protein